MSSYADYHGIVRESEREEDGGWNGEVSGVGLLGLACTEICRSVDGRSSVLESHERTDSTKMRTRPCTIPP